jgi:hypothetical protein
MKPSAVLLLALLLPCRAASIAQAIPARPTPPPQTAPSQATPPQKYDAKPAPAAHVYRITGVVVSSRDGAPIPRCRMTVTESGRALAAPVREAAPPGRLGGFSERLEQRRPNDAQEPDNTLTDSTGHFTLIVPKAGRWRLTGEARGFRTQAYDEHDGFWSGIVLTPAAPEIALTFRMTPDGLITGIVFDEAGEPVRNAQVAVSPVRPRAENQGLRRNGIGGNSMTDDRGRYEIAGLAPGPYKLRVNAHPWYANGGNGLGGNFRPPSTVSTTTTPPPDPSLDVVYPETWFPAATAEDDAEIIQLAPGEQRQADFHLTPVPSIHLRVPRLQADVTEGDPPRGPGVRPPMVMRENSSGGGFAQGTTITSPNSTEWDIGGLAPGSYQVRVPDASGPGQRLAEVILGPGASVVDLNAATPAIAVPVTVDGVPDDEVRQVLFVDPATGQSYTSTGGGRNRRPRGNRGSDDEEDEEPTVRTVSAPPGRYEVYLAGSQGLFMTGLSATGAQVAGRTVDIAGGSPKLTVHAANGLAEVDGFARIAGKPISGALVLLVPAAYGSPENIAPIERDETNTDGSFFLRGVFPGEYILVSIDHGWNINWHDMAALAPYLAKGTPLNVPARATLNKVLEAVQP